MKWLLAGGILVAGVALTGKAANAGNKLESQVLGRFGGIDGDYLRLEADVFLTNPTDTTLEIAYPYVKVSVGGEKLADNRIRDSVVVIPARTTIRLKDSLGEALTLLVPYQRAVAVLGPLLGQILAGTVGEVRAEVLISTKAYAAGLPGVGIEIREEFPLRKPGGIG